MYKTYLTNGKQLSFNKPQVMAIINLTPDSFYDGGKFSSVTDVLKDADVKIRQGATMLVRFRQNQMLNLFRLKMKWFVLKNH